MNIGDARVLTGDESRIRLKCLYPIPDTEK
jgi:hypothetical protein